MKNVEPFPAAALRVPPTERSGVHRLLERSTPSERIVVSIRCGCVGFLRYYLRSSMILLTRP